MVECGGVAAKGRMCFNVFEMLRISTKERHGKGSLNLLSWRLLVSLDKVILVSADVIVEENEEE